MRKAFTLIELLVVIAIIAILASILFPVFAQAKAAAKKTQALSNAKQLASAYLIYVTDSDGVYYEAAQGIATGTEGPTSLIWNGYLLPYAKNSQLALDPAAPNPQQSFAGVKFTGQYFTPVDYKQLSIGINTYFTSQTSWGCVNPGKSTPPPGTNPCATMFSAGQFQFPAQQVMFVSSAYRNPASATGAGFWVSAHHAPDADDGISDIHNGFSVVSFMDSHAKAMKATTILVSDQEIEVNPAATGQCVNYDVANVYWDPTAPLPTDFPLCEGLGIR